ncbi:MAG: ATP-binding protein [Halieaceae bacterium]|jgi:two-component system sensor histidine kinase PilS (NtrC family)|nr:ATP-binding protein [Halieaceae bacterium]
MRQAPAILQTPAVSLGTDRQNITLFRIYVAYRSLLSIMLVLSPFSGGTRHLVGELDPRLYIVTASIFLATNLPLLALIQTRFISSQAVLFTIFFVDVFAITILSDTSGGIASGLPILLLATAAASAVLITHTPIATLIAALSVIAILADTVRLINQRVLEFDSLLPAGLLSALIFSVSLLIQVVAKRVGKAEAIARARAEDLYTLQRLNEQIVQNLQTGILLVYSDNSIRVMNEAASRLLHPERSVSMPQGLALKDYNATLAEQFTTWLEQGVQADKPLTISEDTPQVIASFQQLKDAGENVALVFLNDYTLVTQQAQSLKLNSLGRLTASIAHEIRNPLGAVSHAAQLLNESDALAPEDRHLAGIIENHARRMNNVIENVLQISRRQPPSPQKLALKGWLQNFLTEYQQSQPGAERIALSLPQDWLEITFDPAHLERVLGNLLDNALRYGAGDAGSGVALQVMKDNVARRCLIDVIDTGPGVPSAERAKLFEPFYTTSKTGTGLGLFLSKELCEINNATLTYLPTPEGESRFRVSVANFG